jgi:hypothetical protein
MEKPLLNINFLFNKTQKTFNLKFSHSTNYKILILTNKSHKDDEHKLNKDKIQKEIKLKLRRR